jgi:hypothetical protein
MQGMRILGIGCLLVGFILGAVRLGWLGAIGVGFLGGVIWACVEVVWNRLAWERKHKRKPE